MTAAFRQVRLFARQQVLQFRHVSPRRHAAIVSPPRPCHAPTCRHFASPRGCAPTGTPASPAPRTSNTSSTPCAASRPPHLHHLRFQPPPSATRATALSVHHSRRRCRRLPRKRQQLLPPCRVVPACRPSPPAPSAHAIRPRPARTADHAPARAPRTPATSAAVSVVPPATGTLRVRVSIVACTLAGTSAAHGPHSTRPRSTPPSPLPHNAPAQVHAPAACSTHRLTPCHSARAGHHAPRTPSPDCPIVASCDPRSLPLGFSLLPRTRPCRPPMSPLHHAPLPAPLPAHARRHAHHHLRDPPRPPPAPRPRPTLQRLPTEQPRHVRSPAPSSTRPPRSTGTPRLPKGAPADPHAPRRSILEHEIARLRSRLGSSLPCSGKRRPGPPGADRSALPNPARQSGRPPAVSSTDGVSPASASLPRCPRAPPLSAPALQPRSTLAPAATAHPAGGTPPTATHSSTATTTLTTAARCIHTPMPVPSLPSCLHPQVREISRVASDRQRVEVNFATP